MKLSPSQRVFQILNLCIMFMLAFLCLMPFVNIVAISLSTPGAVVRGEVSLIPVGFYQGNYAKILGDKMFFIGYRNTIMYTLVGTMVSILLSVLMAYPLSKRNMVGNKFFTQVLLFTMLFGPGLIPKFLTVRQFGLMNSFWGIIIPFCISTWNVVVMRTFFQGIPDEIEDAAMIDGCNPYQTLVRIVLPLSTAVLSTMCLFYAVGYWNGWFWHMLLLDKPALHPVSLYLRKVVMGAGMSNDPSVVMDDIIDIDHMLNAEGLRSATIILVVAPILMVYPFIQKYFQKGMVVGSLKG